jgi:nucleotide-binding universal stress UspA family protein
MVRHVPEHGAAATAHDTHEFAVLVPLDGSHFAEKAIPVAERLARKWNAALWLARVVECEPVTFMGYAAAEAASSPARLEECQTYLDGVATDLGRGNGITIRTAVLQGPTVTELVNLVKQQAITHVVMSTHGRTALSRVLLGSVADGLIHELRLPIVLIPALAPGRLEDHEVQPLPFPLRSRPDLKSEPLVHA